MTSQPVAFVRKASGLRRDVSLLDVVSLNLSNMSGGAALGIIGFTTVLLIINVWGELGIWLYTGLVAINPGDHCLYDDDDKSQSNRWRLCLGLTCLRRILRRAPFLHGLHA